MEQVPTNKPEHGVMYDERMYYMQCGRPSCHKAYLWNFQRGQWDCVSEIKPDDVLNLYSRNSGV